MATRPQERADHRKMISDVISRFNEIEFQLTAVLVDALEFHPTKRKFAFSVLFNNAIIPFAQKVKLMFNLREEMGWPKVDPKPFHRIAHIRNQFAHSSPHEHLKIYISTEEDTTDVELTIMLESIDGSARLKSTRASDALKEFNEYDLQVSQYLRSTRKTRVEQDAADQEPARSI